MGEVRIDGEDFVWGPDAETLPLDIRGEGDRILHLDLANRLKGEIIDSGQAIVPEPLLEVFALDRRRGSRRRVVVNTPGQSGVPLFVWARPDAPAPEPVAVGDPAGTGGAAETSLPAPGQTDTGGTSVPPSDLGPGDAMSPPPQEGPGHD